MEQRKGLWRTFIVENGEKTYVATQNGRFVKVTRESENVFYFREGTQGGNGELEIVTNTARRDYRDGWNDAEAEADSIASKF